MKALTPHLVLAPDAAIDLQMHTTYSDGRWAPSQLIDYLVSERFGLVAITDHDRVDTITTLQQLAAEKQLPLLAAVEMSTSWKGEPTDLLCYGFDPENNELNALVITSGMGGDKEADDRSCLGERLVEIANGSAFRMGYLGIRG